MQEATRLRLPRLALGIAAFALGSLAGLILRLALFGLAALVMPYVGARLAEAHGPPLDPVYTRAAMDSLADLRVQGLAVAAPLGDWLHSVQPSLFADPSRVHWAVARIVIQPGSPVLGRLLAAGIAHAGVLGAGLLAVRSGYRHRHAGLLIAGVAMQVQVALSILGAQPSVRELEATGVSFALNAMLPWLEPRSAAVTNSVEGVWPPAVAGVLVALALLIGYAPAVMVLLLRNRPRRLVCGSAALVMLTSAACAGILHQDASAAEPVPVEAVAAASAVAPSTANVVAVPSQPASTSTIQHAAMTIDRWFDEASPASGPSHVQIVGADYQYQYLVNGEPQVIRGMGLNTQYSLLMSPAERAAQLDRDMSALAALGVNTVLGWDPAEFDGVLLDAAQRYGIGVVLPFDLDPEADYTDPQVRASLRTEVLDWVARYRTYPALRMWGLGNEVLHKIVHPAWVGPQDPLRERNAEAFSDWLVETADAIHAADADHPVTYRSAEDAFVDWVVAAFERRGGGPRPWFVWGTNCYQPYLGQIVDHWTQAGMPTALWVSEFAPGGMAVPDRPDGFAAMWGVIRRHPEWVLGGAVYAWTRNGPEGVDRNFGLTDDGQPVDGRSLDMLSSLFHTD